jgi:hypothetical protein
LESFLFYKEMASQDFEICSAKKARGGASLWRQWLNKMA